MGKSIVCNLVSKYAIYSIIILQNYSIGPHKKGVEDEL